MDVEQHSLNLRRSASRARLLAWGLFRPTEAGPYWQSDGTRAAWQIHPCPVIHREQPLAGDPPPSASYTVRMSPATRRRWDVYEERCRREHVEWLRSLSPSRALELYEDFHRFVASLKGEPGESERLEKYRWREKLALRKRLVAALRRLDEV